MNPNLFAMMMASTLPPENLAENLNAVLFNSLDIQKENRATFALMNSNNREDNHRLKEQQTAVAVAKEVLEAIEDDELKNMTKEELGKKYKLLKRIGVVDDILMLAEKNASNHMIRADVAKDSATTSSETSLGSSTGQLETWQS